MKNKKEIGGKVTIDELARMMNSSFEDIRKNMATKSDLARIESKLEEKIGGVKDSVNRIENRFERRIEILEDDVRVLKTTIGTK
jgi:hypothetical protein